MASSAELGMSSADRWGKHFDAPTPTWHTNPPEWAAYVGHVMLAARSGELHVDVDMRCKRVEADVSLGENGRVVLSFHVDLSDDVQWPGDLGPWTHENRTPTLTLEVGDRLLPDMYVAGCVTGRYVTRAVCLRRVDWDAERTDVEPRC
jgi:hypothetical protein